MYLIGIFEIVESRKVKNLSFTEIFIEENTGKFIITLLQKLENFLKDDDQRFLGYFLYKYIANFLSSIGDSLLSMCDTKTTKEDTKHRNIEVNEIFNFNNIEGEFKFTKAINMVNDIKLGTVLRCYYLSGNFFLKYGRSIGCSYEYRKILYVLKTVISPLSKDADHKAKELTKFISFIYSELIRPLLEIASQNVGHADRHMVKKIEKIYGPEFNDSLLCFTLNNISNNPETREIIIVYNYLKIKLGLKIVIGNIISSCNSLGTQFLRLMELEFYAKYIFQMHFNEKRAIDKSDDKYNEYVKHGIDYLYSMLSMLRIQKIYGNDFLIGHSSFAYTHLRIGKFLKKFKIKENPEIQAGVENIVGKGSYTSFDYVYHFQMAKDLYNKVIQLHTAGKEYKKTIGEMIYLEDDFSDTAYHFGAAINRYLMINDDFVAKIAECDKEILGDSDRYYNPEELEIP